jgi:hypothetical protein
MHLVWAAGRLLFCPASQKSDQTGHFSSTIASSIRADGPRTAVSIRLSQKCAAMPANEKGGLTAALRQLAAEASAHEFWPKTLSSAEQWSGFCPSTHVLALVPTTPNPTVYGVLLYQTCTFSAPFRRKITCNRGCDGEPVFARANPQAGRRANKTPPKDRPGSPTRNPACLAAGAQGRGPSYPTPKNARKGHFRPRKGILRRIPPKHFSPAMIWRRSP